MGLNDMVGKAKDAIAGNQDKIDDAVDKAADFADEKTGGKHTDKIDTAADKVKEGLDKIAE